MGLCVSCSIRPPSKQEPPHLLLRYMQTDMSIQPTLPRIFSLAAVAAGLAAAQEVMAESRHPARAAANWAAAAAPPHLAAVAARPRQAAAPACQLRPHIVMGSVSKHYSVFSGPEMHFCIHRHT